MKFSNSFILIKAISALALLAVLSGCATVDPKKIVDNSDPWEETNRSFHTFNDSLDRNVFKPVSRAYKNNVPVPIRIGVTNFYDNLGYLNVILNSFLQGKLAQGSSDSVRFLFNSTVGLGGLFDAATRMNLPKHNEDLGQTFATWGLAQGSYVELPIFGPNTVRNTPNLASGALLDPFNYVGGVILFPLGILKAINTRANLLDASDLRDEALDPYAFTREAFLQRRKSLIYDGELPLDDEFDQYLDEEMDEGASGVLTVE
ncbi:MAG: MlaA family lipoprotein [Candidatus Eutrophobiaceae bacterium]